MHSPNKSVDSFTLLSLLNIAGKASDYDFLAAQLGVTREAVSQTLGGLKKHFAASDQEARKVKASHCDEMLQGRKRP